jgi:3-hydroxymyristoyl/3-hydroxydecanoyl-(acyl carrier protein) dehydratase
VTALPVRPDVRGTSVTPGGVVIELDLPESLSWFRGHFPGHPILPGVVQLAWAVEFAHAHLRLATAIRQVTALKFLRVIRPGATIRLALEWSPPPATLAFHYSEHGLACSSGRIHLPQ